MPTPGPEGLKLGPWRPKPSLKRSKPGFGGPKLSPGRPLPSIGRPKPGPMGLSQTQGGLGQTFLLGPCKIWLRPLDQASEANGQASLGLVQASQKGKHAERQIERRTEIPPCVLKDFVPFGATALQAILSEGVLVR